MQGRLIKWYDRQSMGTKIFVRSVATAVPFYAGAYLSYHVTEQGRLGVPTLLRDAGVFIAILTGVVFVTKYVAIVREDEQRLRTLRQASRLQAYALCDRALTKRIQAVRRALEQGAGVWESFVASTAAIQEVVSAAYQTLEAAYGAEEAPGNRVDFEATFMTRSFIDGHITIPACANREGRQPRSMVLRRDNPQIYENTVTAMVYKEPRPQVHIIPDTTAQDYAEIYPGQLQRIKSSIIFPVLSDTNELLGTLVVHCDRSGFFRRDDEKYWCDLLEVFAKRIALEKAKLDGLMTLRREQGAASRLLPPGEVF